MIVCNVNFQRNIAKLRKQSDALLEVWLPLRWAWSWISRSWGVLSVSWLLPILIGLRRAISGLAVGIWMRWIWCSAVHRSAPRHDRVGDSSIRGSLKGDTALTLDRCLTEVEGQRVEIEPVGAGRGQDFSKREMRAQIWNSARAKSTG